MKALATIVRELIGLFIDDGAFAVAILIWLIFVGLLTRLEPGAGPWGGPLLFAGLAAILVESAFRRARK